MAKIIVVFSIFTLVLIGVKSEKCEQQNACVCAFSEYSKFDLTHIFGDDPKNAAFLSDRDKSGDYSVYFHGCTDAEFRPENASLNNNTNNCSFKETTLVLVNSTDPKNITCTSIGSNKAIRFNEADDKITGAYELEYTNGEKKEPQVLASVRLVCDNVPEPYIKIKNIQPQPVLISVWLNSPHACIYTQHPGMSRGSVLLIIFLILVAVYFFGGALILYFIRGARGTELIPNIDFWRSLPGLVKDGCIFTLSGCNPGAVSAPDSYDRI